MSSRKLLLFLFLCSMLTYCKCKKDDTVPTEETTTPRNDTTYLTSVDTTLMKLSLLNKNNFINVVSTDVKYVDTTLMKLFLFNKDSYWVYKDSASGSTDSIACDGSGVQTNVYMTGGMGTPPQYVKYSFASNYLIPYSLLYHYFIQGGHITVNSPLMGAVPICSISSSGKIEGDSLSTFLPSVLVNGVVYTDVYKFHVWSFMDYKNPYYYMKPGIGIIKVEYDTNDSISQRKVFELVRYKIK